MQERVRKYENSTLKNLTRFTTVARANDSDKLEKGKCNTNYVRKYT